MEKKAIKKKQSGVHLFNLVGFEVRLDFSWFFLAILVAWTLAAGYFPMNYPELSVSTYWIMGLLGTIGLFFSIILHELCHSLVGRYYGIPIEGITLFIFGGIANMSDMPPHPKAEFFMAIVGPLFSLALAMFLYVIYAFGIANDWQIAIIGVIGYLSIINFVVGIFNLLPGFPLDGGRVFRSILWWWKNDIKWATDIACRGGSTLGVALIIFGIFQFFLGALIAGLWMFILGFFIERISKMSYENLLIRQLFRDEPVRKYAKTNPVTVTSDLTISEVMERFFYHYYHKLYPVVDDDKLLGCITLNDIKQIGKDRWQDTKVRDVMERCSADIVVDADTKVTKVLQGMNSDSSRRIVVDNGELYGIITLKDLMDVISVRISLEENDNIQQ